MNDLYPLKFKPILKEKIWGGRKLETELNKDIGSSTNTGESWEISGVDGDISVVENGFLSGNSLQELIEIYMGDLVGDAVFQKFGEEFPLLIKFIDASDVLSIQVHPDDKLAKKRHEAYGKTEMWYVIDADKDSDLISGFKEKITKEIYSDALKNNKLEDLLNFEKVKSGDVFFIPAGRVHAIGKGILLAEIQQTSDITYRIYDWKRKDKSGKERELHTELALDAIDYKYYDNYKTDYSSELNQTSNIINCNYFKTNILSFDVPISKDYNTIDSFVIYMSLEGSFAVEYEKDKFISIEKGETVLVPAVCKNIRLIPSQKSKILEVFV